MSSADRNKELVLRFYDLALNEGRPEDAVEQCVGYDYIQHNPTVASGKEAFIGLMRKRKADTPGVRIEPKRAVAEDDMVMVHSKLSLGPDGPVIAVMDAFRLENGRIVEHWDVLQPVPENPANDNGMF